MSFKTKLSAAERTINLLIERSLEEREEIFHLRSEVEEQKRAFRVLSAEMKDVEDILREEGWIRGVTSPRIILDKLRHERSTRQEITQAFGVFGLRSDGSNSLTVAKNLVEVHEHTARLTRATNSLWASLRAVVTGVFGDDAANEEVAMAPLPPGNEGNLSPLIRQSEGIVEWVIDKGLELKGRLEELEEEMGNLTHISEQAASALNRPFSEEEGHAYLRKKRLGYGRVTRR